MRDFMVSAGKKRKLYDIPAEAPATACCHKGRGASSVEKGIGEDGANEREGEGSVEDLELR
jgi:hypothetical protein